ncbi:MAG: type II secretion system protein GspG [Candidatus Peribacteria bacterium]|nr:MAG: type II secretion system protein GspG [Candidatus Peribacteria bacterium]
MAFQGYAKSARDGSRISDLSGIKQTLELYALNKGKYPETTYGVEITYSGSEVWTQ